MYTKLFDIVDYNGYKFQDFTSYSVNPNDYFLTEPSQYIVTSDDIGKIEQIAFKVYGIREYYRYIMLYNYLEDPFNDLQIGMNIRIPAIDDIRAYEKTQQFYNKWTNVEPQFKENKWK